ncbi:hypothetical protein HUJ04_012874 [Dendroctonus ponderosae]|nr:hypothetical protein HUJ04_012874 [Dendroctonus ponderosae]
MLENKQTWNKINNYICHVADRGTPPRYGRYRRKPGRTKTSKRTRRFPQALAVSNGRTGLITEEKSYKQIPFLVIGDFNSKNEVWGGNVTNRRGTELLAWCNLHSLTIINDGLVPTLVRQNGQSYLSIISDHIQNQNLQWKVLKDPDITEHKFIVTKLTNKEPKSNKRKTRLGETNIELLIKTFKEKCQAVPLPISVPEMTTLIRDAYHECTPRVLCNEDYQMPFWWSEGIQTAIQEVQHQRRQFQRVANNRTKR